MLESINEIKILCNNNFNRIDYVEEDMSLTFENFKHIAAFIGDNFKANGNLLSISFLGNKLFNNFEENLLPMIVFIKELNPNYQIKLYFNEFEGSKEIFEKLSIFSNIRFIYNLGFKESLISEENMELLLDYFPLTSFNYYLTPENYTDTLILDVWKYYSKYNLFYFNFEIEYEKNYSDEFFQNFDQSLRTIDLDVIEQIRNYSLTTIPANYKYFLWKIGAFNYCFTNANDNIVLPEQMCAYKCGYGCYKNLIIDKNGEIFSCHKIFNAPVEDSEFFHVGNIKTGMNGEKVEALIVDSIDTLVPRNNEILYPNAKHNCSTCNLNKICTRGCPTLNYLQHHNLFAISSSFCDFNTIFYNHALELVLFFEASKNNSLFKDLFTGCVKLGESNYEC